MTPADGKGRAAKRAGRIISNIQYRMYTCLCRRVFVQITMIGRVSVIHMRPQNLHKHSEQHRIITIVISQN